MYVDPATSRWWTLLRAASALNLVLFVVTAFVVPMSSPFRLVHLVCCAIYVVVCGFRSFYPRVDLERTVLVDHPLSSIALGRSAATVAELAFTLQLTLFVAELSWHTGLGGLEVLSWTLVPLIVLAQTFCWLGVLTLNHLWHAAEEAVWGLMMILLALGFLVAWPHASGILATLMPLGLVGCGLAAFVMLVLDLPMYARRARDEADTTHLGVAEGARDALVRRVPTGEWGVWKHEVAWMTPYFTAGVWLSIAMVWL